MTPPHKPHQENQGSRRIGMGFGEFVVTIAIMTASIAMAIDSMLPALPNIGHSRHQY
ncbi:ribosomal protein L16/L10AE [Rhizobium leguminosarum]|nr:ribosomal protein L16/L10AE [Rhizobium leguminosarum]